MSVQAQKVFVGTDLSSSEKITLANGDHGFCMVVGGYGTTGWARLNIEPINFENLGPKPDEYFMGGDFGPDGNWYCVTYSGGLYEVDTITAEFTQLASFPGNVFSGFTYSPAYDKYFICTGGELFTIDMDTYDLESVGPMGNAGNMVGIGADFRGKLWGVDTNDDKLYSIDPNTGLATAIGESGFDFDYIQGCTYNKTSDEMAHAGFWVTPSVNGGLFTYDFETGVASESATFPDNEEVTAISFPWEMPAHGSISGLVSESGTGNPVEDVEVRLEPTDGNNGSNIIKITGIDGLYNYAVVLPGEYQIVAVSSSYSTQVVGDIIVEDGDELEINIELSNATNTASFTVFDIDGSLAMEGVLVNFAGNEGTTDVDGNITFENIAEGTYDYTANYDGYYEGFGELTIESGNYNEEVYLYVLNNLPVEKVIIEEATGTWCGPCGILAPNLDEVYIQGYPMNIIAYHAGDPYENDYASSRNGYYGVVAYPTLTFMGQEQTVGVISEAQIIQYVESYAAQETPVAVSFNNLIIDDLGQTINGNMKVINNGPVNSENMRLHLALVENHIPENWQGLTELNFVERDMFPDNNGTEMDFSEVGEQTVEFSISTIDVLDLDHAQIVAFVQDNLTKEIFNGTSMNADLITGVSQLEENSFVLFPNPADDYTQIQSASTINEIQLFNSCGQLIENQININSNEHLLNTNHLQSGVYFISIKTTTSNQVRKLFIK
jgi:hypothetical protein